MRIALVTTTINMPHVLRLYRALDANVRFFVAGDWKTPLESNILMGEIGNAWMIFPEMQRDWACSELIGWNCIQRRNIATLEALKWGADIIVFCDDDNLPVDGMHFFYATRRLGGPYKFTGLQVSSSTGWFDVGQLLDPVSSHRGFPYSKLAAPTFSMAVGAKVGVNAGICLGDPDIDAVTRIAHGQTVHRVSELLRAGIVIDPVGPKRISGIIIYDDKRPTEAEFTNLGTWTVFNSQNTAFVRELAPAMFMLPGVGRYDDIFASLIAQRVMRQHGYVTHFGPPFVWQQRNAHNLIADLKAEIFGMEHIVEFANWLDVLDLGQAPVLNQVRLIYGKMSDLKWMPAQASEAGLAWCEDCEKVL